MARVISPEVDVVVNEAGPLSVQLRYHHGLHTLMLWEWDEAPGGGPGAFQRAVNEFKPGSALFTPVSCSLLT